MNKNEKKEHRFNMMDGIVLLFVLICILGLILRIWVNGKDGDPSALNEFEVYFSASSILATSESAFVAGDTVWLSDHGRELGTLSDLVSVTPTVVYMENDQGEMVKVTYPEGTRIDVIGVISAQGNMGESGFLLGGTLRLSPGISYVARTEHLDITIKILEICEK